jgi:DNA-binding NarL/FixJ family response regulator
MTESRKIRVLLVDDEASVRRGLRMRLGLEPDLEVAGEAASGRDAVLATASMAVDVIVMDLAMPGGDGLTAVSTLATASQHAAVVVLSFHDDRVTRAAAARAGATAFISKGEAPQELVAIIRRVAHR